MEVFIRIADKLFIETFIMIIIFSSAGGGGGGKAIERRVMSTKYSWYGHVLLTQTYRTSEVC